MNTRSSKTRRRALAALALSLAGLGLAHANDAWPTKTITLVSPYPTGGITDLLCRIVG